MRQGSQIVLYGGVGRIGGNAILVQVGGSMALFDLGKDFQRYKDFFTFPFTLPTKSIGRELIKTGILPELKVAHQTIPLYVDYEGGELMEPTSECPLKHLFVSHPHLDHSGFITLVRRDTNIHMGTLSSLIFSTNMETRADGTLETRLFWGERKRGEESEPRLTFSKFHSGHRVKADSLTVTPYSVDHSVPGAYGFLIETSLVRMAYTGDLRFHGSARLLSRRFQDKLMEEPLDALIVEGTNMNVGRPVSEERVEKDARRSIEEAFRLGGKLVIVEVKSSDIDRVNAFVGIAKDLDSAVAITTRMAYLLDKIERSGLSARLIRGIPKLGKDVKVLMRSRAKRRWEKKLMERPHVEFFDEKAITKPEKKTILLDSGRFNVFDVHPPRGTLYIQSVSEHVNEEEEYDEERFLNTLALHGLIVYRIHSSGHANPLDLVNFISKVKPKVLIPIHTEHPETFHEIFKDVSDVVLPEKGSPIPVG